MSETELERMVVRLVGDGSSYQTMFKQATTAATQSVPIVESAAKRIEAISNSLRGFAGAALGALGTLGAMGYLKQAFGLFQERENSELKLRAVIKGTEEVVVSTMDQYKKYTQEIKHATNASTEATYGLLRTAETFGLTGKMAEQAATMSIAFAAAAHGSTEGAEGMVRIAAALAKGDIATAQRFGRMIPQLRGVKDQTEFLTKAQEVLNSGMKVAQALADSTSGRMHKFYEVTKDLTRQFGQTVAEGIMPMVQWLTRAGALFKDLEVGTKRTIVLVGMIVVGILGIAPALSLIKYLLAPFTAFVSMLVTTAVNVAILIPLQVVSTALWLAWKVVVLAATVVMSAFNIATGLGVIAIVALLAVIAGVGAAVYATYKTATSLFSIFGDFGGLLGPFGVIRDMFGEWLGIIKDVVNAAKTDLPLAWKLAQTGAALAVSEIKDLWPPFWGWLKTSFAATWEYISLSFVLNMKLAVEKAALETMEFLGHSEAQLEKQRGIISGREASLRNAAGRLEASLRRAGEAFAEGFKESDATKVLREEVKKLQAEVNQGGGFWHDLAEQAANLPKKFEIPAIKAGEVLAAGLKHGMDKFDATLRHSAEANARIIAFQWLISHPEESKAKKGAQGAGGGGGGMSPEDLDKQLDEAGFASNSKGVPVLKQIRDILQQESEKPTVKMEFADIA